MEARGRLWVEGPWNIQWKGQWKVVEGSVEGRGRVSGRSWKGQWKVVEGARHRGGGAALVEHGAEQSHAISSNLKQSHHRGGGAALVEHGAERLTALLDAVKGLAR